MALLIDTVLGIKLVYILGITNIITLLLVLASCRCTLGIGFFAKLWQKAKFKKFYNLHCYFWALFWISVILHAVLAIIVFGIPNF